MEITTERVVQAYRLVDSAEEGSQSLRSKLSLLKENGAETKSINAMLRSMTKQDIAERTACGELSWCSPMIPVFQNLELAYSLNFSPWRGRRHANSAFSQVPVGSVVENPRSVGLPAFHTRGGDGDAG